MTVLHEEKFREISGREMFGDELGGLWALDCD